METLLLVLLIVTIVLVYLYFRPSILKAKNRDFRLKNQEYHNRIDARFHHKYIDAGHFSTQDQPEKIADTTYQVINSVITQKSENQP